MPTRCASGSARHAPRSMLRRPTGPTPARIRRRVSRGGTSRAATCARAGGRLARRRSRRPGRVGQRPPRARRGVRRGPRRRPSGGLVAHQRGRRRCIELHAARRSPASRCCVGVVVAGLAAVAAWRDGPATSTIPSTTCGRSSSSPSSASRASTGPGRRRRWTGHAMRRAARSAPATPSSTSSPARSTATLGAVDRRLAELGAEAEWRDRSRRILEALDLADDEAEAVAVVGACPRAWSTTGTRSSSS